MDLLVHHEFNSIEDFLMYLEDNPPKEAWSGPRCAASKAPVCEWSGGNTFDECMELARIGWPEGLDMMESVEVSEPYGHTQRVSFSREVAGFRVEVPAALMGDPKCMIRMSKQEVALPIITIKMVAATGAHIGPETYKVRGAIMASLIDSIEESGGRVELYSTWLTQRVNTYTRVDVKIKSASQPLDRDLLAFVSIHPGWLRRIMFRWMESHGYITYPHFSSTYGRPTGTLPDQDCFVVKGFTHYDPYRAGLLGRFETGIALVKEEYEKWLQGIKQAI